MIEILPIKSLTDTDSQIFGGLNVGLGKLGRSGLDIGLGIVVTAPHLKLRVTLEHFDFGTKELFEQSLTLVRKEIEKIPSPEVLKRAVGKHSHFLVNGVQIKSVKKLWIHLLSVWLEEIKNRLWREGFYKGITESLEPQVVIFVRKLRAFGSAHYDEMTSDSIINAKFGKLHPNDLQKLDEIVKTANKKLFIPHEYEWMIDQGVKLTGVLPYTPNMDSQILSKFHQTKEKFAPDVVKSAVKVFLDMSTGLVIERVVDPATGGVDGVYIASEKIFDLNKPGDSYEDLLFRLVESAAVFPHSPVLFKLADKSEGMGKVRGTLRLLHQQSLFQPMVDALDFVRHKKGLTNIHIVIPFIRGVSELMQIKRELAVKKLGRKNSLKLWVEIATPENIINLEDYLVSGLDGVVLNLDELIAYLNGFDHLEQELTFYKNEVEGLLKFLEDSLKLLHKSKVPFIAVGNLALNPKVLEFLVEKGLYGIVVERYEAHSAHSLLHQAEKKNILSFRMS